MHAVHVHDQYHYMLLIPATPVKLLAWLVKNDQITVFVTRVKHFRLERSELRLVIHRLFLFPGLPVLSPAWQRGRNCLSSRMSSVCKLRHFRSAAREQSLYGTLLKLIMRMEGIICLTFRYPTDGEGGSSCVSASSGWSCTYPRSWIHSKGGLNDGPSDSSKGEPGALQSLFQT